MKKSKSHGTSKPTVGRINPHGKFKGGTNYTNKQGKSVQGTGKSQSTSPSHTHKKGGAIMAAKKSKGPLDNRGKDADKVRMDGGGKIGRKQPYAYIR